MRPVLRTLHSPDLLDMENGRPEDPGSFQILVQALIGASDSIGEESFDFIVCTPDRIDSKVEDDYFLFGAGYLIVRHYDYERIRKTIVDLCDRTSGATWNEIGEKLNRFGHWEFQDYRV